MLHTAVDESQRRLLGGIEVYDTLGVRMITVMGNICIVECNMLERVKVMWTMGYNSIS